MSISQIKNAISLGLLIVLTLSFDFLYGGNLLQGNVKIHELRCEYAINPLGIDTKTPKFSWILESVERGQMQSAYQVLVATSLDNLQKGMGDKWDSKKVKLSNSVNIPYEGNLLSSGEKCFWKVRVWNKKGKVSDWSETATFEMGLLEKDDWIGKWVGTRLFNDLSYTEGKVGQAVLLKGEDQPIKARFHRLAKLEDGITISAWVKPDHFTDQWQTIYRKEDGDATQVLALGERSGKKGIWFGLGVSGVYEEDCALLPDDFFNDGAWHFIAVTYDRVAKRIYLDGKEIKIFTNPGLIYPRGYATAHIGSFNNQHDFFRGAIDEVRLHRNAINADQIINLMDGSLLTGDLIAWWDFEGKLDNRKTHRSNPSGNAQLLRREFEVNKKIKRARVYFSGLCLRDCLAQLSSCQENDVFSILKIIK